LNSNRESHLYMNMCKVADLSEPRAQGRDS